MFHPYLYILYDCREGSNYEYMFDAVSISKYMPFVSDLVVQLILFIDKTENVTDTKQGCVYILVSIQHA